MNEVMSYGPELRNLMQCLFTRRGQCNVLSRVLGGGLAEHSLQISKVQHPGLITESAECPGRGVISGDQVPKTPHSLISATV